MQKNQANSPLGWGIIGCPNGYQVSSMGADKLLNIAHNYLDLKGNIGEILPDPDKKDATPLFCLAQFEEQGYRVFTLAEYHSIKQKGSNRSGTFLGSFVEVVGGQFDLSATEDLFKVLHELCGYQYDNFVDHSDNRYKEEIFDKPLPSLPLMKGLEEKLKQWKDVIPQTEGAICLVYQTYEQLLPLFQIIMEVNLLAYFKRIYLSSSSEMVKGIHHLGIEVIQPSFSEGDKKLRSYLQNTIQAYIQQLQLASQASREVQQQLENVQKNQESIVAEKVEKRVEPYIQKAQLLEQEKTQIAAASHLVTLGKRVLEEVGNRSSELGRVDLSQFSSGNGEINDKLLMIENRIVNLSNNIDRIKSNEQKTIQPQEPSNFYVFLMAALSLFCLLFFILTIYYAFIAAPSESKIKESSVYMSLKEQLDSKSKNEKLSNEEIPKLKDKITNMQGKLDETEQNFKKVCSLNDKKNKEISKLCSDLN